LTQGTTVLGALDELPHLNIGTMQVPPGASFLTFTDGLCELENESQEEFGIAILKEILLANQKKTIKYNIGEIIKAISKFKGTMSFSDDLALMGVRFKH
jgi:sigma-B regulation protein RsbU (phosphoserine phosphatase)